MQDVSPATSAEPLTATSPPRAFLARWRALQAAPPAGARPITVSITASFTIELLLPYLGVLLCQRGLYPRFRVAPFNQIYQALLDPQGPLRGEGPADLTLVLPRLEDLCAGPLAQLRTLQPDAVAAAREGARAEVGRLLDALARYAQEGQGGALLCGTLPPPASTPLGLLDVSHPASWRHLLAELNLQLWQRRGARVRLFDVAAAVGDFGAWRAYDDRLLHLARCPFADAFLRHLAAQLTRAIVPLFQAPAKVLALDLDNTLWGGIIGEDGLSGIALSDSGAGAAYVAFQEALLDLRRQGMLLCLVSKNNEADALEVLDRHPAMRLHREHLAGWQIAWHPKSESLRRLAEQLSLGLSSFVFIDDNPVECEEIRRLLPEVTVLQMPEDATQAVAALRALPALDRMVLTDEDLQRAEQYAAEQRRSALQEQLAGDGSDPVGLKAYLSSLELRVTVRRAREGDLPRVAQLTQKTNQFNLTTVRRSEAQVAALHADPAWRLYTVEVTDRFGAYGLTGVVLAQALEPGEHLLDTVLLSCRVLGRGVETAALRAVAMDLRRAGAQRLRGRFTATAKNAPARGFLAGHGFVGADPSAESTSGVLSLAWLDERGAPLLGASIPGPPMDHVQLDGVPHD